MTLKLKPDTKCLWKDCEEPATTLASGRKWSTHYKLGYYCEKHSMKVAEDENPEYVTECPVCGCRFGVN